MASIKARASFIGLFHSPTIERDGQRAHAARVRVAGEYEPVPSIMTHAAVAVGAGRSRDSRGDHSPSGSPRSRNKECVNWKLLRRRDRGRCAVQD